VIQNTPARFGLPHQAFREGQDPSGGRSEQGRLNSCFPTSRMWCFFGVGPLLSIHPQLNACCWGRPNPAELTAYPIFHPTWSGLA